MPRIKKAEQFVAAALEQLQAKVDKILAAFNEMSDPKIGNYLKASQKPQILLRNEGYPLTHFKAAGGIPERLNDAQLNNVTKARVLPYQARNIAPYSYGAFNSATTMAAHKNQFEKDRLIYVLHGPASSMQGLKEKFGIAPHGRDSENEQSIIQRIPYQNFLAVIAIEHREAFFAGQSVPNQMHFEDNKLPKNVKLSDLASPESTLLWLKENKSVHHFDQVCKELYFKTADTEYKQFKDPELIKSIDAALERLNKPAAQQVTEALAAASARDVIQGPKMVTNLTATTKAVSTAPTESIVTDHSHDEQVKHQQQMKQFMHKVHHPEAATQAPPQQIPPEPDSTMKPL